MPNAMHGRRAHVAEGVVYFVYFTFCQKAWNVTETKALAIKGVLEEAELKN